jgi:sirohydrochlorin ferrochelatase
MSAAADSTGIIIISHGSPLAATNDGFVELVGRIASRLGATHVVPAFYACARPDIADQVALLYSQGVRRIVLMPFFLFAGQHVTTDIPALLDECRRRFPQVTLEFLPTLENDPALEDLVVERLDPFASEGVALPGAAERGNAG